MAIVIKYTLNSSSLKNFFILFWLKLKYIKEKFIPAIIIPMMIV